MNETTTDAIADAANTAQAPAASTSGSRVPGKRWWILWAVLAIAMGITRHPEIPDRAIANAVLLICGALIVLSFLFWMSRFSCCPKVGRWMLRLLCIAGIATPAIFRVETFRGSLQPELALRWAQRPDQELEKIDVANQVDAVDLTVTSAADFPRFLGPNGDNVIPGVELKRDWSTPPEMLWKQSIGAGWSGFAAVNGYAVTLEQRDDKEILACYEITTGKAVWIQEELTRHESAFGYVGPRSTPTIHNGRVYANGGSGRFRCVDGATGDVLWAHDLFAENGMDQETAEKAVPWGRAGSPLIVDDKVVVPVGGPSDGPYVTMIAFNADTGVEVWRAEGYQISYASPQLLTLADVRQIVSVNQDYISSHSVTDGTRLWEHPWNGKSNSNASASQAVQVGDNQVYASKGYTVGSELFEVTPAAKGEWDTETIWTSRTLKTKFTNVSMRDGYAYGLDDGLLACQELATGKRQWKRSRYGHGQSMLVGDTLLVLDEDGAMHMVAASPEKHEELGAFQAIDGMTWNTFCLYGDLLLVRNAKEAACFRLPLR